MNTINGYNLYQNAVSQKSQFGAGGINNKSGKSGKIADGKGAYDIKDTFESTIDKAELEKRRALDKQLQVQQNAADPYEQYGIDKETGIQNGVELSDKAKAVLEELKEKYGNIDFFVADDVSNEDASGIMSAGTREFSVLIDPDTLEAMAEDDAVKEKYMGIIDDSTEQLASISEELEESGQEVESLGVKIDADGVATFFAKIKESNENYKKQVEAEKEAQAEAARKAEAKAKAREEQEERLEALRDRPSVEPRNDGSRPPMKDEPQPRTAELTAASAEELLEKIKNFDWSSFGKNSDTEGITVAENA